jgi:predicted nucleic acid-binding protein
MLAYLGNERGAAEVEGILDAAQRNRAEVWMSIINVGEVLYITERKASLVGPQRALGIIAQLPIEVVDAGATLTFAAAHVKAHHSIAYSDAFVVALAQMVDAQVVTGDPEFDKVGSLVAIRWIG